MAPIINFSGIASGIDSSSLIKAMLDRERAARVTPLQTKIGTLQDTNDAFGELKGLLTKLQTAAAKFRVVNGGSVSHTTSSSDESVVSTQVSNAAQVGTYNINVTSLAKNATYSFRSTAGVYTSADAKVSDGANFSDTITVKIGDTNNPAQTVTLDVDQNKTLSQLATDFNNSTTRAVASVVNVGTSSSPDYRLVINTNKTGIAEGQIDVSVGSTLQSRNALNNNTENDAQDASLSITGIAGTIKRSSNSISDLIPGLTFNLKGEGSSTVSVGIDSSGTSKTIQDFVSAYNEVIDYISKNDQITRQEDGNDVTNIFGTLANSSVDENLVSALRGAFSSSSLYGRAVNTLADLGIATQRDGSLSFDSKAFAKALNDDPEGVAKITANLGDKLSAVDGTIAQFVRINGIFDGAINSNKAQISTLQDKIGTTEKQLSLQQDTLTQRFSRLESLIGQLNSQQSTLSSILPR